MTPVTQRTKQGWRASIVASTSDPRQLCEVHAEAASTLSIKFDVPGGSSIDDAGQIVVETRVDEAVRTRTFPARRQGFALNVPAGVTRAFCVGFSKPYNVFIQLVPGLVTTEHLGITSTVVAAGTITQVTPEFARTVRVTCLRGTVAINVPGGVYTLAAPGDSIEMPAYADTTVAEASGINAATVAFSYEVTA